MDIKLKVIKNDNWDNKLYDCPYCRRNSGNDGISISLIKKQVDVPYGDYVYTNVNYHLSCFLKDLLNWDFDIHYSRRICLNCGCEVTKYFQPKEAVSVICYGCLMNIIIEGLLYMLVYYRKGNSIEWVNN